jgi:hypothetical protein
LYSRVNRIIKKSGSSLTMLGLFRLWLLVALLIGAVFVVYGYSNGQVDDTRGYASII